MPFYIIMHKKRYQNTIFTHPITKMFEISTFVFWLSKLSTFITFKMATPWSCVTHFQSFYRDTARFSNPGGQAVMWWVLSCPLVGIGWTELPNSEWSSLYGVLLKTRGIFCFLSLLSYSEMTSELINKQSFELTFELLFYLQIELEVNLLAQSICTHYSSLSGWPDIF